MIELLLPGFEYVMSDGSVAMGSAIETCLDLLMSNCRGSSAAARGARYGISGVKRGCIPFRGGLAAFARAGEPSRQ
jgi:hypothetical protein